MGSALAVQAPAKVQALLVASVLLSCCACGGPPPAAPLAPAAPAKVAPATLLPPAIDLGAVPAPASLVVSGRLRKPAATLALAHEWTQLPLAGAEQITELVAGEALGPIVDLDEPIDVAVATSGEGMRLKALVAVSAGVKDPDNVRSALGERYKLVPKDNGVFFIQGLGAAARSESDDADDSPADGDGDRRACELAPSFGTPSIRLVCASDARALAELGPWLTRSAPRDAPGDDLRLDVRMAPVRSTLVSFRRMATVVLGGLLGDGAGSGGAHDAAVDLAAEFLDFAIDLDTASLALDLGDTVAHAKVTATFAGSASTITRIARAHADGGSEPPRVFWQLPADTDVAVASRRPTSRRSRASPSSSWTGSWMRTE
jgi:hypothetical protein